MTITTDIDSRRDTTGLAAAIEGSFAVPYAPWVWNVALDDTGGMTVAHCDAACIEPAAECACYVQGNQSTFTAADVNAAYEHLAQWKARLCCPDPGNFCAEDADQILQHMIYGRTIFG